MASFPYMLFKRGWRRTDGNAYSDDAMHLPLPVSRSTEADTPDPSTRRRTQDQYGKQRFRLLDKGRAGKGIVRFGLAGGWYLYWSDIFHTLLNMPRTRFLLVFFSVYLTEYLLFALLYLTQPDRCVGGVMKFSHAMWFSVQTAATLGYTGHLEPNPDCTSVNVLVIFQVITAALIDYCMMGLVFARFASPNNRSFTIRFSSTAVLFQRPEDGLWCLSFRLANIRKHSLINPKISLMFALPAGENFTISGGKDPSNDSLGPTSGGVAHFRFQELVVEDAGSQIANLRLGLHAHVNHVIRPGSPLFDRSLDELQALSAEVLCFMEGVDPMTSNSIQARHSYIPADIRMNERFVPIELKLKGGELGLDFSGFDATSARALAAGGADEVREGGYATVLLPVPSVRAAVADAAGGGGGAGTSNTDQAHGHGQGQGQFLLYDVEAGRAAGPPGTSVPLRPLQGTANGAAGPSGVTAAAVGSSPRGEVDTMMAVAMSGDMRSHMQALRGQSIRSLTTAMPLVALPPLVPSVAGSAGTGGTAPGGGGGGATSPSASMSPRGGLPFTRGGAPLLQPHPLANSVSSAGSVFGAGGGGGMVPLPAASAVGLLGGGELRDLFDAILTDVGCSAGVKRQAVALKEALAALELVPRGPAELAGRQL